MAGVGAPLMTTWQARGGDEGGGRRRGQQGARLGRGGAMGLHEELLCSCCSLLRDWLCVREKKRGRKERRKRKEKNIEYFLNLKISEK
jgi:hypothetical protein